MKRMLFLLVCLFAVAAAAYADNSTLPDGTQFPMWEKPLHFTKTYYVDVQAKNADDNGPGTQGAALQDDQSCGAGAAAGRAGGDCGGRLSRGDSSGARRHRRGRHDQLRGCAGREGRGEGRGGGEGLEAERGLELRLGPGDARAGEGLGAASGCGAVPEWL